MIIFSNWIPHWLTMETVLKQELFLQQGLGMQLSSALPSFHLNKKFLPSEGKIKQEAPIQDILYTEVSLHVPRNWRTKLLPANTSSCV